jgi:SAM-dependent methyltransferase
LALLTTFRDPAGHLELRADAAYRVVNPPHDTEIAEFLATPLAARLVAESRLIASEPLDLPPGLEEGLYLRHPRVAFVSYPWEWPPSMWMAAANLTLTLCADLLAEGWILKDATPLNVLFRGTQPVFVDVLSVARADLAQPVWFAYGQFIRTFLLPLLAYTELGWPLQASITRRDGYEPEELGPVLSLGKRMRQPALTAVTLPLLFSSQKGTKKLGQTIRKVDPETGKYILERMMAKLLKHMRKLTPAAKKSTWSDYPETALHYSEKVQADKQAFVRRILAAAQPRRVLDIGCNTGTFSQIAAEAGAEVVAIDTDQQAVDRLYRQVSAGPYASSILPLHVDLARPTPAVGWENNENSSFLARAEGHFDSIILLAVIHHILLGSQVPMPHIAALCARLTTRGLIIEWVPPADEKFIEVLRGRDEIYQHITEDVFRRCFAEYFDVIEETTLENQRILFHMQRRHV